LHKKDSVFVTDFTKKLVGGKRIHLCEYETNDLAQSLDELFDRKVEILRMRHGSRQTPDMLISEEALLLARFLRNERKEWKPRIVSI
jgi:hypothetical protein